MYAMDRPGLIGEGIFNLLSNAFKFTPEGGSVRIELTEEGDRVFIRVIDTGSGIQPVTFRICLIVSIRRIGRWEPGSDCIW